MSLVMVVAVDHGFVTTTLRSLGERGRVSRRQGWMLFGGQIASWGNSQALMYFVGGASGLAQVGAVSASQVLLQPLNILLLGAGNWSLPKMTRIRSAEEGGRGDRAVARLAFSITVVLAAVSLGYGIVLLPFARWILRALYDGKYDGAEALVALWVAAYVLSAATRGLSLGLTAQRRADVIAASFVVALPFIVALVLLGRGLGAMVVPLGSAIGSLVSLAVMLIYLEGRRRGRWSVETSLS